MLVTFLFSDVEGSTELLRRLRDRYPAVLTRHEQLVQEVCERHAGTIVDTQGDSIFAAFPTGGGLNAAGEAQRALVAESWPDGVGIRVRMGVHTGEAERMGERYTGLAVHRAARIGSAAHGGQVLVSETTKALSDDLELGHRFRDLGAHKLKDFDLPVRLFQLELDGLRSSFPPPRTGEPPAPRARRRLVATVVSALVVMAAVVAGLLLLRDEGVATLASLAPNSVGIIDPERNALVGAVQVGSRPTGVAVGEGGAWVVNADDSTLSRIDPSSQRVTKTIPVRSIQDSLAAGEGAVWVVAAPRASRGIGSGAAVQWHVVRVDPSYLVESGRVTVSDYGETNLVGSVATGLGAVWAAASERLAMIDPRRSVILDSLAIAGTKSLAVGAGGVWNVVPVDTSAGLGTVSATLLHVNPETRAVIASIPVRGDAVAVATGAGSVWVATSDGKLIRVDPESNTTVATITVGSSASGVAVGYGGVWVANGAETTVKRIDPATNTVVASIDLGIRPDRIAVGEGAVWVTAY